MIEEQVLEEYDRALEGRESETKAPPRPPSPSRPKKEERPKTEPEEIVESVEEKSLEEVAEMHLRDSFWNS